MGLKDRRNEQGYISDELGNFDNFMEDSFEGIYGLSIELLNKLGLNIQQQRDDSDNEKKGDDTTKEEMKSDIESEREEIRKKLDKESLTIDNLAERVAKALGVSEREGRNLLMFIDFVMFLKQTDENGRLQLTTFAKENGIKTLTDLGNWFVDLYWKLKDENRAVVGDIFGKDLKSLYATAVPRAGTWIYMTFTIFRRNEFKNEEDPRLAMILYSYIAGMSFVFRRMKTIIKNITKFASLLIELDKEETKKLIHKYTSKQTFNPKEED